MSFTKTLVVGIALAASASYASAAKKDPVWVELTKPTSITLEGKTFTYGPTTASKVFAYDGNVTQGEAKIETLVESLFKLPSTGTGSLTLAASGDLTSKKSGSFTINSSFDYLAIHYGGGELVFHWDTPLAANTSFSFNNLPNGISNYRAFSSVSAVPEPATYGMLLGGLALLGVVARRRARK